MSESAIFSNPDLVGLISRNFDYLSISGRSQFLEVVNTLPEVQGMSEEQKKQFMTDIFADRARYNSEEYNTHVLSGDGTLRNGNAFHYDFSLVYPKSYVLDIDNTDFSSRLSALMRDDNYLGDIQRLLPDNVLIWNLSRIAGKITGVFTEWNRNIHFNKILIYCNDRETLSYKYYIDNRILYEAHFQDQDGEYEYSNISGKPAQIEYYPDTGYKQTEIWSVKDHPIDIPIKLGYYNLVNSPLQYELHNLEVEDGWALDKYQINYSEDGRVTKEIWYDELMREHNDSGPSKILYHLDGVTPRSKSYRVHNIHREDIPSVEYDTSGNPIKEIWFEDNTPIREVILRN